MLFLLTLSENSFIKNKAIKIAKNAKILSIIYDVFYRRRGHYYPITIKALKETT